jgi:DNA invertase Pin-like site-specific DNA recombinase
MGGRRPKLTKAKAEEAADMLRDNPKLIHEQVARMFGVSRATLYRSWDRYGIANDFEN